ncbi:DUF6894 family protein [Methylobacterium iners]|uniref:DUF6894 family protein n=1 Tax=Methylobacterium iners TaxID=418707 RepID=UPI001EE352B0|nr:hypothetical protein [Methylobacterium iners]
MPFYFFDVHDGGYQRDEEGTYCTDLESAALAARRLLPAIAANETVIQEDRKIITVLVTDEEGRAVYSAALSLVGTWLIR